MFGKNKDKNEVAVQERKGTDLANPEALFSQYAGDGLENVTSQDLLIPRLTILQGLSPQINKAKPEYDPKAKVGEIYDVGLSESMGDVVYFLPVHFSKVWIEWAPRASGKGLVAIHNDAKILQACTKNEKNQFVTKEGNLVSETSQFFGINLSAKNRMSYIPMSSTQLKKSKSWLTAAKAERLKRADGSEYNPPFFYRSYKLTTVPESNNEGDWNGWKIERDKSLPELGALGGELYDMAMAFRESILRGEAKADLSSLDENSEEAANKEGKM